MFWNISQNSQISTFGCYFRKVASLQPFSQSQVAFFEILWIHSSYRTHRMYIYIKFRKKVVFFMVNPNITLARFISSTVFDICTLFNIWYIYKFSYKFSIYTYVFISDLWHTECSNLTEACWELWIEFMNRNYEQKALCPRGYHHKWQLVLMCRSAWDTYIVIHNSCSI